MLTCADVCNSDDVLRIIFKVEIPGGLVYGDGAATKPGQQLAVGNFGAGSTPKW